MYTLEIIMAKSSAKSARGAVWATALALLAATAVALIPMQSPFAQSITFGSAKRIVGTAGADSEPPQLAVSGSNVYVAWHEFESSSSQSPEVYFSRSTNNGSTFSGRVNLSNSAGVYSSEEQIFASGSNVFVIYTEDDGIQKKVYFRRSTNSGSSFAARKLLSDAGSPSNPRVTASGSNVVVAWQNQGNGGSQDIFFRRSTDSGLNFGPGGKVINNASESQFYFQPGGSLRQLAISGTKIIVTWRDDAVTTSGFETFVIQGSM